MLVREGKAEGPMKWQRRCVVRHQQRRFRVWFATTFVMIAAVFLGSLPSYAHPAANWFFAHWNSGPFGQVDVLYQFDDSMSGSLYSASRARTGDAADTWDNRGQSIGFRTTGIISNVSSDPCAELWNVNSIHRGTIDGPGDFLMETNVCWNPSTDSMLRFTITYDSAEEWDTTTGTPGTSELDFWGAMTHEFGHGAGGWIPHWDEAGAGDLCPWTSSRHTMCSTMSPGNTWFRTLGTHDGHTFDAQY